MAFDYSPLVTVMTDLIDDFGRDVSLRKASVTPLDPAKPWGEVEADVDASDDILLTDVRMVLITQSPGDGDREGTFVRERNRQAFVAGSSLGANTLDDSWQVLDGGVTYEILRADPIRPGPTLIGYALELRL